jgi:hypothetical protein
MGIALIFGNIIIGQEKGKRTATQQQDTHEEHGEQANPSSARQKICTPALPIVPSHRKSLWFNRPHRRSLQNKQNTELIVWAPVRA